MCKITQEIFKPCKGVIQGATKHLDDAEMKRIPPEADK